MFWLLSIECVTLKETYGISSNNTKGFFSDITGSFVYTM